MNVDINISRLQYLLSLYGMKESDLMDVINQERKRKIAPNRIFTTSIDLSLLKKVDALFGKGLPFYVDPTPIAVNDSMSVFFRKQSIAESLNFTAKRVVNDFESLKNYLASLDTLSGVTPQNAMPHYTQHTSAQTAAFRIRSLIYPSRKCKDDKDFLRALINNLAESGVMVFEYLESPNKKEKANLDGFFLKPNFIVLKRHNYYKREIFTLLHEVGHCVLNIEEVESLDYLSLNYSNMSAIERWCNDFAFYFLMGTDFERFKAITCADNTNDYQFPLIEDLSQTCFISKRAIFTRLFYNGKISQTDYNNVIHELNLRSQQFLQQKKALQKATDSDGRRQVSAPQPIYSPRFLQTLSVALNDGIVRPSDLYRMNIPARVVESLPKWL